MRASRAALENILPEIIFTGLPLVAVSYLIYHYILLSNIPTFTISGLVISGAFVLYSLFTPRYLDSVRDRHESLVDELRELSDGSDANGGSPEDADAEATEEADAEEEATEEADAEEEATEGRTPKHVMSDFLRFHRRRSRVLLRSSVLTLLLLPSSLATQAKDIPGIDVVAWLPTISSATRLGDSVSLAIVTLLWVNLGYLVWSEALDYYRRTRRAIDTKRKIEEH